MEEVVNNLLKKQRKKYRLIAILLSLFFFVAGSASSISLYNYFYGGVAEGETKVFQEAYNIVKNDWYYGTDEIAASYLIDGVEGLVNGGVNAELGRIDPYLTYYPYEEITPTYGLGIEVIVDSQGFPLYDGYFYISKVYGYSSANGVLKEGDLISKVNGESVRYKNSSELKIKGEKNTEVSISYIRDGKEYDATLTRKDAVEQTVKKSLYSDYAILTIDGFNTSTMGMKGTAELAELYLKEIKKENIQNLIIDLRDNPGGYVSAFKSLSELFIPKNKSLGIYINKHKEVIDSPTTKSDDDYVFDKIVILVNGNSASATEAFAVCMKDNLDNVTVVGTTSFGKGIAQKTAVLSDGSSLRYTYAEYFRPNGNKVHGIGIVPDYEIKLRDTILLDKASCIVDGVLDNEAYGKLGMEYYKDKIKAYQEQFDAALTYLK